MANRRFIDFPVATTVGANDIILIWQDGLNKQTTKATILSGLPEDLEDLADVNISGLTNGQILRYDSTTGKWENTDQGNLDLNDLNDVSIVSPSNGQVLVYNSSTSKWENSSAGFVPYTGAVTTVNLGAQTIQAGSFVKAGGTSAQFLKADGSVDSNTYGTGTVTSVGLTMPAAFSVANSPVTAAGTLAVTGAGTTAQYIRGDGTLATFPALTGFVPYTGATADVNLGTHDLTAERGTFANNGSSDTLTVNHTSGSGYGIIVTKGGNNEALYVSKTSGSGNAMTVVGGRTSLVDLALSSVTNTAGDFLTISGGVVHKRTAAEVRTDIGAGTGNGTVTSVAALTLGTSGTDLSSSVANGTTTPVITLNVPTASASNRGALSAADWSTFNSKQNALTNPVTGTGETNYLPKFTGSTTIGNSNIQDSGTLVTVGVASTFSSTLYVTSTATIQYNALSTDFGAGYTVGLGVGYSSAILKGINMGWNTTLDMGFIGAVHNGTAWKSLILTPFGGSLLIGEAADNGSKLQVAGAATFSSSVTALSFVKSGGTSSQFLKADGSVDSTTYVPVGRTITINGTTQDLSANRTYNVGTVTSVTASSPLFSSGGSTPNITIQQASGSQNGFLSSTDWNTFNNKQNALTNPVTGTGTAGQVAYWSSGSAITGESNLFWDATNDRLGIGINSPAVRLHVLGNGHAFIIASDNATQLYTTYKYNTTTDVGYIGNGVGAITGGAASDFGIAAATGNLLFASGGVTERMRIFSNGNVFIGSSATDAGYKLDVNGTGRFGGSTFKVSSVSDSGGAGWTTTGGASTAPQLYMFSTGTSAIVQTYINNVARLEVTNTGISVTGAATFSSSVSGTSLRSSAVGTFGFNTANNGEFQIYATALSGMVMAGRGSSTDMVITNKNGSDVFTIPTGTTIANFVGKVGIGTEIPDAALTVKSIETAAKGISIWGRSDSIGTLRFFNSTGATEQGGLISTSTYLGFIYADTELMRISSDGNVLIGTGSANSRLQVAGSFATPHTTKSANYTLDETDYTVGFDCASNRTATLPDATTCAGRIYVIYQYNTGGGTRSVTLDGNGSQTINGVTTYSLAPYCDFSSLMIQSNGSNWIIISSNLTADCL